MKKINILAFILFFIAGGLAMHFGGWGAVCAVVIAEIGCGVQNLNIHPSL